MRRLGCPTFATVAVGNVEDPHPDRWGGRRFSDHGAGARAV